MAGGYYWLTTPGQATISWDVVTRHQLDFDAVVGHVGMWTAVLDQLASAWQKEAAVLRRLLKDCCYGLPRGRVARAGKRSLILHGDDSSCPDWLEPAVVAFRLDRRSVKVLFDEHERMLAADRRRLAGAGWASLQADRNHLVQMVPRLALSQFV